MIHAVYDEIQPQAATMTTLHPNPAYEIRFPCKINLEANCAYVSTVPVRDESAISQGVLITLCIGSVYIGTNLNLVNYNGF